MVLVDSTVNSINSSRYPDILGDISSVTTNKILLDNISNWYLFEGQIILGLPILKKYENILRSNLYEYDVPEKYFYRPEYVSHELYETTDLWYLLLFINNMMTPDQFIKKTIQVFDPSIIEVLNKIINEERGLMSTRENPTVINKHYLKGLDEKSDKLLPDNENDSIPWVEVPEFENNVDLLFKDPYNKNTTTINKGLLTDEEGNLIPPYALNSKGLFNVPSVYYKDGYTKKLMGKIYLFKGTTYGFVGKINGESTLKINNLDTKKNEVTVSNSVSFGEAVLISDLRKANNTDHTNVDSLITYNKPTGRFSVTRKNTNPDKFTVMSLIFSKGEVAETVEGNFINSRLDVGRLDKNPFIFCNLEYSSEYNAEQEKKLSAMSYEVTLTYTDNTIYKENAYVEDMGNIYNTKGHKSFLKFALENKAYKTKSIKTITITLKSVPLVPTDNLNFNFELSSFTLVGKSTSQVVKNFTVKESKWYGIELDYVYTTKGIDSVFKYPKESYQGILFKPEIRALAKDGELTEIKPDVNDGNISESLTTNVKVNTPVVIEDSAPKYNELIRLYSTKLKLPDQYILTVKLKKTNDQQLFDFDFSTSGARNLIGSSVAASRTSWRNSVVTYSPPIKEIVAVNNDPFKLAYHCVTEGGSASQAMIAQDLIPCTAKDRIVTTGWFKTKLAGQKIEIQHGQGNAAAVGKDTWKNIKIPATKANTWESFRFETIASTSGVTGLYIGADTVDASEVWITNIKLENKGNSPISKQEADRVKGRELGSIPAEGGGVGIVIDYNEAKKSGYMFWVSSISKKPNPNLPSFVIKDEYDIMPSGFYELDMNHGKAYPYFDGDNTLSMSLTNFQKLDIDSKVVKIIKRYNRIRLLERRSDDPDDYDYGNPIVNVEDYEGTNLNDGLMFLSAFAGHVTEVLEFYPYSKPKEK